jgi:hypothetical protein
MTKEHGIARTVLGILVQTCSDKRMCIVREDIWQSGGVAMNDSLELKKRSG